MMVLALLASIGRTQHGAGFIERPYHIQSVEEFERKLILCFRKYATHIGRNAVKKRPCRWFYICSLSRRTIYLQRQLYQ